ncbi:hypothetical protein RRF57_011081 [Xylaria bambusicola]|uniref:Uncharacterized protein n=1 Tax=Xylaria bambusicola TaxID=326684 RepID=A0AAN7V296_9PEZI
MNQYSSVQKLQPWEKTWEKPSFDSGRPSAKTQLAYWENEKIRAVNDGKHEKNKREPSLELITKYEKKIEEANLEIERWGIKLQLEDATEEQRESLELKLKDVEKRLAVFRGEVVDDASNNGN